MTTELDPDTRTDAPALDKLINRCVAAVAEALNSPARIFTTSQQQFLRQIYKSMRWTHGSIRELRRFENKSPMSVDAMPLVRLQLETLYAICVVIEDASYLDIYLKDSWKTIYIRFLLQKEECRSLPKISETLNQQSVPLEQLRRVAGVTDEEKLTIEGDELGTPLPQGRRKTIPQFPTPGEVLRQVQDRDRKRMLSRLYIEYKFLCSFVHFSPHPMSFKAIFDPRESFAQMFDADQTEEMFNKEIAGPAVWIDFLSVVQSCAEMIVVYPGDVELRRAVEEAWRLLAEGTVLGRAIWEIRTRNLLGVIQ